jgi:hypothetical protein|tara:strand:- start:1024 stop:2523 length:1500 start_codon:yes stop_codon:yes gene_type:complete
MAYTINSFTGVNSDVTIEDGTVNQSTALRFIGKNYAGYGELQNENFYHLLENFAGTGEPARKAIGMLWYDASENRIRFYDGQRFRPASGAEVSVTQPEGQTAGDFWFDSANDQVFVYTGSQYVLVGPQTTSQGQVTQLETGFAKSSLDGSLKPVVRAFVAGDVIFTVSQESFPINTAEPENINLSGFVGNQINSGITLRNTNTDGITTSTTRFWGTASSAANLVVNNALVSSSNFVQVDSPEMTAQLNIRAEGVSGGLTIGAADSFKIYNNSNVAALVNSGGTDISFADSTAIRFRMNANVFRPETDSTNDLGTTSVKFRTIYADTFDGVVTQSQQLEYNGNASGLFARAQVADSPLTIPVRDGTGTVFATTFNGVSTSAQYADLAEKYTTPSELPVGTTVAVCNHPDHEVDVANTSSIAIGVVSLEPAFKMNAEADGQYIGLKGRVPVRVSGPVTKGQAVYAWENGVCTTTATTSLVGIALETNSSEGEKLVECVLKV